MVLGLLSILPDWRFFMAQKILTAARAAIALGLLCTIPAFAQSQVQSLQGPYRKLLEKTMDAQMGKHYLTNQFIYQLPESSLIESSSDLGTQVQVFNRVNQVETQIQMLKQVVQSQSQSDQGLFNREALRKNPVTLVVVPGVFGEFIDPLAFNEITGSSQSTLARAFASKVQSLGACKTGKELHCDFSNSLESMRLNQSLVDLHSMQDLLSVSSIDDEAGNVLARVVLFKTPRMSMESISRIEDIAAIFNRRLQKYFALMGAPEKYAYVGYSRGTMVALEMLKQSQDSRARGLFVVGGVTLGSDLADQINVPGTPVNRQLTALRNLSKQLRLTYNLGFLEAGRTRIANLELWINTLGEILDVKDFMKLSASEKLAAVQKAVKEQMEKSKNTDARAVVGLALSVATKYGLLSEVPSFPYISINALSHEDYSLNVLRFQKFVDNAYLAVSQLTTQERIKWWSNPSLKLPAGFTLYTFAATMADAQSANPEEKALGLSQWSSGPFTGADYLGLIQNYRDLRAAGQNASLNDSQVATAKVIGWPSVIQHLNPNIEIQTKFLALFGAHHWALALPVVNVNKDKSINPFPRSAFLESMAHVFANERTNP